MSFPDISKLLMPVWQKFENSFTALPKALLLDGSGHVLQPLLDRMIGRLFCSEALSPCGSCQNCRLLLSHEHPDIHWITAEKSNGTISIEVIRDMQQQIHLSPQLQSRRLICINVLDAMSASAANALLKILEEPPAAVYFIACTENISLILPTVLSRFQKWRLPYVEHTQIISEVTLNFLKGLDDLCQSKVSVCELAEDWSKNGLLEALKCLYYLFSEMIRSKFSLSSPKEDEGSAFNHPIEPASHRIAQSMSLAQLFSNLSRIETALNAVQHTPAMNAALTLESILLDLREEGCQV